MTQISGMPLVVRVTKASFREVVDVQLLPDLQSEKTASQKRSHFWRTRVADRECWYQAGMHALRATVGRHDHCVVAIHLNCHRPSHVCLSATHRRRSRNCPRTEKLCVHMILVILPREGRAAYTPVAGHVRYDIKLHKDLFGESAQNLLTQLRLRPFIF